MRRLVVLALVAMLAVCALPAGVAWADGDPGSDVLVYQDLFAGPDAGMSVVEQAHLGNLLQAAARAGVPVRVAIIATPADLGAVTALWDKPRAYASFLGYELSLAYKQRLLVVMPNGFGFDWRGHPASSSYAVLDQILIGSGGAGLVTATETAVRRLAAAAGIRLAATAGSRTAGGSSTAGGLSSGASSAGAGGATASSGAGQTVNSGQGADSRVALVTAALAACAAVILGVRYLARRRRTHRPQAQRSQVPRRRPRSGPTSSRILAVRPMSAFAVLTGTALVVVIVLLGVRAGGGQSTREQLAFNPVLDPGTAISAAAPDFTLDDQFGRPVSLHSFRGKVVLLAFNDSECTTICPLMTRAMLDAKAMLGKARSQVQLLGIDANPASISLEDVWSYSELHGMLRQWHFLTGSLAQLKRVWKAYGVEAAILHGQITHTPALFVISSRGIESKVYLTQMSYSSIGQLGKLWAQEASSLLPGHPAVHSSLTYAPIPAVSPAANASLPRMGGGTVALGPSSHGRLFVFFATWDQGVTSLAGHLDALSGYASTAKRSGLPPLSAVDEGSVEPSSAALSDFLRRLPAPLGYPVGVDDTGRVADGYEVQGEPWFVLISPDGHILWYWQVSTSGWPTPVALVGQVQAALARAPKAPSSLAAAQQELAGSPAPLAALHTQASRLLGNEAALVSRIRALRGYPIVVNAWASWCTPCRAEFDLFAAASARYGRQVAFLGADTDDSAGDAHTFLTQHPVAYPSYEATTTDLRSLAVIEGLPTTIFINRAGQVFYVHIGQYDSQGTLDTDIVTQALGG